MLKTKTKRFGQRGNRNLMQRKKVCYFCVEKREPILKDLEILRRFVSDRGKILNRERSGVCRKHQNILSTVIKRARLLALLPFALKAK